MTAAYKKLDAVEWEPHFMTENGRIKWIYTRERDDSPISVMLINIKKGTSLPEHVHKDQPDLIFVLQGRATMFIDGVGEFPLEPQMVVQVPKNTRHTIRNIEEDILIYNVFAPAMKYMKPGDRL
jgi:quercetin dioxygenase-like cupin family protein